MNFRRARSAEQHNDRRQEIKLAALTVLDKEGFDAVTFKQIAAITSLSRPSLYNYYITKEEIFLDVLQDEYLIWQGELQKRFEEAPSMSKSAYCMFLAMSLLKHTRLLELMAIHLTHLENNCREERLTAFDKVCSKIVPILDASLSKFFPLTPPDVKSTFRTLFLIFVNGLYPCTHLSAKQNAALTKADLKPSNTQNTEELALQGIMLLAASLVENKGYSKI
jgi:AcrR family transcriptional regulator